MQDIEDKERYINTGRLIHMLSNQMKRRNASEAVGDDGLTTMQKHVLKHILLETMHREVYQKDIEEEFRIRKSTATGILQLMKKWIYFPGKFEKGCQIKTYCTDSKSRSTQT